MKTDGVGIPRSQAAIAAGLSDRQRDGCARQSKDNEPRMMATTAKAAAQLPFSVWASGKK
jgi:hypothetical protein